MPHSFTSRKRIRRNFGSLPQVAQMPNLIGIQKLSYDQCLQIEARAEARDKSGLESVFNSVFPIEDASAVSTLEYVSYDFDEPKYDVDESVQRGVTYAAPLKATFRLIVWDVDEDSGTRDIKGIKEQEVYICDLPLMTQNGTFVINGVERVIVSQMHRSPGAFFDHDKGKTHASGKYLYSARIIPYRGSWLDLEFDAKDVLYFRIDRRRKLYISTLLRALGVEKDEIISRYYGTMKAKKGRYGWAVSYEADKFRNVTLEFDLVNAKSGKIVAEKGTKIGARKARKLEEEGLEKIILQEEMLPKQYLASDVATAEGEVLGKAGASLSPELLTKMEEEGVKEVGLAVIPAGSGPYILDAMALDKNQSREDALIDIYKVMRPGEPPTVEAAEAVFSSLFFDRDRYDLSDVGRVKMNARLGTSEDESVGILTNEDIMRAIATIIDIKDGKGEVDDIDHLGNRRVRSVGESLENQFRIGLLRMERGIVERMGSVDPDTVMPNDIINAKPLAGVVKEFFGSSQLSQFMDQTNPLSEVTHKRRLSALGPGGLTRERAGFEVRDVHATHYGRICPIETPEGPNIGLINSLATYAQINRYGFIESPYRKVKKGVVTDEVEYLSAIEESKYLIAQSNAPVDKKGKLTEELVNCRHNGDFKLVSPQEVDYADLSPKQLVSVASALIPFLENDDANRALMGSNMMRQAVPLICADAPFVGTGMEDAVARDSGSAIVARRSGVVDHVDATRIVVRVTDEHANEAEEYTDDGQGHSIGVDIYTLRKFQRSNQNTCINQRPIVHTGDVVRAGDVIADGPSTSLGELALGANVLAAFMPWNGYNFEDSILISERIAKDDVFTSVHIEEFEIVARDTKLGPEEITRDIPNIGEESLTQLDETGVVHVGAEVHPGDILVGKVTPKSESPMTPEEKLLRAIFGEKAADVRDTSMRMKPGVSGRVVEVRIFSRRGVDKDERAMAIEREEIERLTKDRDDEYAILSRHIFDSVKELLAGKKTLKVAGTLKKGAEITQEFFETNPRSKWWGCAVDDDNAMEKLEALKKQHDLLRQRLDNHLATKIKKVQDGDDLPSGVLKMVKVFVAVKRKLQPGDKMAGRHGNKGVISRICPVEDMPYLEDGTPVDLVLNPLGVPSRMNVGQILETHLGWAAAGFGRQVREAYEAYDAAGRKKAALEDLRGKISSLYHKDEDVKEIKAMDKQELEELASNLKRGVPQATPVFDGAREKDVSDLLEQAGCDRSGQVVLRDGRTGEVFDRKVTVGYIYMLKLHHLVDDKIHARSIGPYSLVTQQPLGGKSHFGGQRFGEMECWALQAYGAAYTLQELLTVKSDDVVGRTRVYESIVKGDNNFESGIPESFHVMVKELRSLCLNMELYSDEA